MSSIYLEILFIFVLILANGVLAMSEIAVVSARKVRLQQRAEAGEAGAQTALELANTPTHFLSTVQIGITLVGILAGAFGGATVAEELGAVFNRISFLAPYSEAIGVAIVVILITYLSLVIGELVPKQIALTNPERVAAAIAPAMRLISRIAAPFVNLLSASTEIVLRLLKTRSSSEPSVTEEEVRLLINQGVQGEIFEPIEEKMVEQVFRLGDLKVTALMTPRLEIIWLDLEDLMEELQRKMIASGHAYFPVAQGDFENIVGIVAAKDLLIQSMTGRQVDLKAVARPALFIPASMPAFRVVERFKETHSQIGLVLDEYGSVSGLVTTSDILEAVAGEFPEAGEEIDQQIVQREDGTWLVDGMLSIKEFREVFGIKEIPGEKESHFQTLGGFMMASLGRIPKSADHFLWGGYRFEVVNMDRLRVDKVLVSPTYATKASDRLARNRTLRAWK